MHCFVIQPFNIVYNKRFDDVYQPAIEAAKLSAYRVDRDPNVEVPYEAIEEGIQNAAICLADITVDNPNVWYEVGFALALKKQIVLICAANNQREKFPFDVQHRGIITYSTDSSQDFKALEHQITKKIEALQKKHHALKEISQSDPIKPVAGLSQQELAVLVSIAGSIDHFDDYVGVNLVKKDVERSGFTPVAFNIGLRRLQTKEFVKIENASGDHDPYWIVYLTQHAWEWIEVNEDHFAMKKGEVQPIEDEVDEIPF